MMDLGVDKVRFLPLASTAWLASGYGAMPGGETPQSYDPDPSERPVEELLRILLVEDNPGDVALVRAWLAGAGQPHHLLHAVRLADAEATLSGAPVDVVLLDLSLPDARDLEGLTAIRRVAPDVAVIILTGLDDEAAARASIAAGAHDYLQKDAVGPGQLRRSIALARARAELARSEAQLLHTDRLNTLGQLAAGIAHEINNPLQFVTANVTAASDVVAELLEDADALEGAMVVELDALHSALRDARTGAERISSVVRALNNFSRAKEGAPQQVDLAEIVREAATLVGHRVRQHGALELALDPVPPVVARGSRIVQVLVNLLVNAAQAIESAGRPGTVRVTLRERRGWAEVAVRDDGVGMSAHTRAKIFDSFFTTKPAGIGTGLGLALSQAIVEEHGGTLMVRSRLGKGTTFVLRLPVASVEARRAAEAQSPPHAFAPARPLRILIVDDEPLVLRSMQRLLGRHELTSEGSGRAALARIEAGARFDAVLCDLSMPGLSGRELHARVAALDPALAERFLFVTGGALTSEDRAFAEARRAISKPVSREALEARLAEIAGTGDEDA